MKISIGFITFNYSTFKYLDFFLPSLKKSLEEAKKYLPDLEFNFLIVDNSSSKYQKNYNYLLNYFNSNHDNYKIFRSKSNLGFSKAYNKMINWSIEKKNDLFLMLNPDVLLDLDFFNKIIIAFNKNKEAAVLAPKILYWDFENNKKTKIIDSCGVGLNKCHYFFDINQGGEDLPSVKPEELKEVFGFTGAGALLNLKKLKEVAYYNENKYLEFFDELMFMYKEDVDISYRLQLLGAKIFFVPEAIMYHDRSLSKNKHLNLFFHKNKSISRSRSFLNQLIILYKIRKIPFSFRVKLATFSRFLVLFAYGLFFERRQLIKFKKMLLKIDKKAQLLDCNLDKIKKIETFM